MRKIAEVGGISNPNGTQPTVFTLGSAQLQKRKEEEEEEKEETKESIEEDELDKIDGDKTDLHEKEASPSPSPLLHDHDNNQTMGSIIKIASRNGQGLFTAAGIMPSANRQLQLQQQLGITINEQTTTATSSIRPAPFRPSQHNLTIIEEKESLGSSSHEDNKIVPVSSASIAHDNDDNGNESDNGNDNKNDNGNDSDNDNGNGNGNGNEGEDVKQSRTSVTNKEKEEEEEEEKEEDSKEHDVEMTTSDKKTNKIAPLSIRQTLDPTPVSISTNYSPFPDVDSRERPTPLSHNIDADAPLDMDASLPIGNLSTFLEDTTLLRVFLKFLKKKKPADFKLLEFYLMAGQFKDFIQDPNCNAKTQRENAKLIIETFFLSESPKFLELQPNTRHEAMKHFVSTKKNEMLSQDLFDKARQEIKADLISRVFPEFMTSDGYKRLVEGGKIQVP
ncbi:myb domain-containing protein [Reticulomyxa filosa]|uniref:Myb domain-containing protein n=1 Tax=Reticulomyxa filosa TaxID=46433 RepID=X6NPK9_RETFI|nr:myb domain-containing protein [Reticulomyxa filosa]|eukprot:ETO27926.1 myb domain-containing protein [Reticulomyxa filosa]